MTISIAVLFLNGGIASTAVQPLEIFNCTGRLWNILGNEPVTPMFNVTTASLDGNPVRTDRHLSLTPECGFADLDRPDIVFVPAGGCELEAMFREGYDVDKTIKSNCETVDWLVKWAGEGSKIATACSGVLLPAMAGLLDGKVATAHWGLADHYRRHFPKIDWRDEYLVTDTGDIFCGGGVNAAADLSLYIVEKYCGRETAIQTARAMVIEMPRTWQSAFIHFSLRAEHGDSQILKAQHWLQEHFATEVHFDFLAQQLGMSNRNFARRFKDATGETPLSYLQTIRISTARRLLENSQTNIQEIAEAVGYIDLIFFRNLFKRHTGMSPNGYRNRFGQTVGAAK